MVAPMMIKDHMEIVGMAGFMSAPSITWKARTRSKLTKDDSDAAGEHHFIPLTWVDHVDAKVHLKQSGAEAKARWKVH
jgi:hypothetical protein